MSTTLAVDIRQDPPAVLIWRACASGLRPEAQLEVSEWADKYRRLPKKSSAEPGPWRTDRTPYLREIMDCFSTTSIVEEVVFMKAAQVGGSEAILNAIGYVIDHSPGPAMIVQPTVELAKRFSRQRLEPLILITPRVKEKVSPPRARDSGNTMLGKEYPGGQLILTGANSAVGLRSMPAQIALMDEVDGYPVNVDDEGSPIALVEVRQRTFVRKKRAKISTPTIAGRSAIEEAYEGSDKRRYYVPCPDCGEMQPLEFGRLKWTELELPPAQAVYECRACFRQIKNHEKTAMLSRGEWRPEAVSPSERIRGYHLNALYAPVGWMSWGDIAVEFVKANDDQERLRVFVNTVLGETWTAKGESPEWEQLRDRREAYRIGTVPLGGLFLTAGLDVQKDRIVYEIVAWGRDKRSWSIDYGELPGDTSDLEHGPWPQASALLDRAWPSESGLELSIVALAVDSGYNTQTVYDWSRKYPSNRVFPIKGYDAGGALVGSPSPIEVRVNGRKSKRGGRVWPVVGGIAKSEFYGFLRVTEDAPGRCHFPEYGDRYFREITAEKLVPHRTRKGYVRLEWEIIAGRQNHALDCRVYARAAASLAGVDRMTDKDWRKLEQQHGLLARPTPDVEGSTGGQSPPPPSPTSQPAGGPRDARRGTSWVRRSGWMKR